MTSYYSALFFTAFLPITVMLYGMAPRRFRWAVLLLASYGFFFAVTEDEPVGSSGEVVLLEVTELDEDGQPAAFEFVEDEAVAAEVYEDFRTATKDLYDFSA